MKQVNGLKIYSQAETLDKLYGKKGTAKRDKFDANVNRAIKRDKRSKK